MKKALASGLVLALASSPAHALLESKNICHEGRVSRTNLTRHIVITNGDLIATLNEVRGKPGTPGDADVAEVFRQVPELTIQLPEDAAALATRLAELHGKVVAILRGQNPAFSPRPTPPPDATFDDFMAGRFDVVCTEPKEAKAWQPPPELRLRKNIDDLGKERAGNADVFNAIETASIAYTRDVEAGRSVWDIDALLGYSVDLGHQDWRTLVPFVQVTRQLASNTDGDKATNISKLSFGLAANWTTVRPAIGRFTLAPRYITDFSGDSRIGDLRLSFTPPLHGQDQICGYREFGPVGFLCDAEAVVKVGRVFEDGGILTLADKHWYTRYGVRPSVAFTGTGAFKDVSWLTSYRAMFSRDHERDWLPLLESSLNWGLNTGDYKLLVAKLSYADGKDEDTKQRLEKLTLGFGLRF